MTDNRLHRHLFGILLAAVILTAGVSDVFASLTNPLSPPGPPSPNSPDLGFGFNSYGGSGGGGGGDYYSSSRGGKTGFSLFYEDSVMNFSSNPIRSFYIVDLTTGETIYGGPAPESFYYGPNQDVDQLINGLPDDLLLNPDHNYQFIFSDVPYNSSEGNAGPGSSQATPAPTAIMLTAAGVFLVGQLRRRRILT